MKPCRHHLGIVEHHDGVRGDNVRYVTEDMFAYSSVPVFQKLGCVPALQGVFGNPFLRKRIVIVIYLDLRYHFHESNKNCAKIRNCHEK